MSIESYAAASGRSYGSILREVNIRGEQIVSRQLPFTIQAQTQSNWCWAATSTSVSHFYWISSIWTQCIVANKELGRDDCCSGIVPSQCNVPWYLDRALTRTNNFVSITGPATFQQVRNEIDAGQVLGARIGWKGGGGHFLTIFGYSLVGQIEYFDIDDPIYGKSHLTVGNFSTRYQGTGSWTHTYFTKGYVPLPIKLSKPSDLVLRRISDARTLLAVKLEPYPEMAPASVTQPSQLSFGLAHPIYSLDLRDLLTESDTTPKTVGQRVFEIVGNTLTAFFDLTAQQAPEVIQLSASQSYLGLFTRALTVAMDEAGRIPQECELRLFRIPALNFEALWLKYERLDGLLVPILTVGSLPAFTAVRFDEALVALREAAQPLSGMDDTMGA